MADNNESVWIETGEGKPFVAMMLPIREDQLTRLQWDVTPAKLRELADELERANAVNNRTD